MASIRPREKEVYSLRAKGMTEREIARLLNLSYCTVKTYSRRARQRTGRTSMEIAVAVAVDEVTS